ncbi:globin domain-containing protein [Streptomyces thermoviolaceus]|jgi:nitric oxide dioxygenase|uniref:globin domain-containing protein n=1 Tax=Streptomyces TaxID=1883 RepID=UPI000F74B2C9|nr:MULTISPECIES: globin domain-containing protein [Streptomyces]MCM3264331.1 globin domain-containing protein [Streptomyces thermoviolaceus]RSS08359.1 hemin transporter [Streptomyces sp. WAC00469]WTD49476.1 globin domain-containing protein [Streptomyces thermoviolaceus]GGV61389.1 hemin transporter [Streptomyces thermoviolaceus subsp. apingens]
MLSDQSAAVVRATLPAVGAAIEEITERFYARLFDAHPELLRDLFNRGNQASGTQKQALAGSIAAFATHLVDHPDQRPDAMLQRIAHKHASLGVLPEQYPVVHEHLFAAIAEVLGDAVTEEVAAAWTEVYWLMANALIALEKRLYEQSRQTGWREWKVVERIEETADVVTFRLRPVDDGPVPGYRAGQYVSVGVTLPDGARQIRQYSLTAAPGSPVRQFAVKRVTGDATTPDGEVSTHLHAHVHVGDVLQLSAPYGDLVLEDTGAPLLLASAGIGVTPMIAMLEQLAADGHDAPVTVVHADRSPAAHALRDEHLAYAAKLPRAETVFFYERDAEGAGRPGLADLTDVTVAPGTHAYLCGPLPFMRAVREQLLAKGVAPADIHYEVFGPDLWLARQAA